jgi:hypothetical protein
MGESLRKVAWQGRNRGEIVIPYGGFGRGRKRLAFVPEEGNHLTIR